MADPIQDLPGEIWKPVVGYEGLYEVSNMGRVKSLHMGRALILRPGFRDGYETVRLFRAGDGRPLSVHRLVLLAFVGPRPEGTQACHNDGCRTNNVVANLRWDTCASNNADKERHGTAQVGARNGRAKLDAEAVASIRKEYAAGATKTGLARKYNIHARQVGRVISGEAWGHLPNPEAEKAIAEAKAQGVLS